MELLKNSGVNVFSADINNLSVELFSSGEHEASIAEDSLRAILHTHSYTEFFFCISGRITINTEGSSTVLFANDVAVMPSDYSHVSVLDDGTRFMSVGLMISRVKSKRCFDLYKRMSPIFNTDRLSVYRDAPEIIDEIVRLPLNSCAVDSPLPVLGFILIAERLLGSFVPEVPELSWRESEGRPVEKDRERMLLLEKVISEDYTEPYDAEKIASKMFISRRHLDRVIMRDYGKTLREVIYENRVELSKRMLVNTSMKIEEVGVRVGFSSLSAFKKAFVKHVGCTPSEYRRANR